MQLAKRERTIPDPVLRLALVLLFGAIMGLAGPFGTYPSLERPVRYAFWIGLTLVGYGFGLGSAWLCCLIPGLRRAGRWTLNGATALMSAVPMTFVVAWTMSLVQPGRTVPPAQLPALFMCVAAVQIVIVLTLIRSAMASLWPAATPPSALPLDAAAPSAGPPAPPMPPALALPPSAGVPAALAALLSRLPADLGPDIVALEAEDHYVRVHTPKGSTLVLMRLSDAVDLMDAALGMRVHRSWWVALRAIDGVERNGQRLVLRLSNGAQVPVGRMHAAAVRSALDDGK